MRQVFPALSVVAILGSATACGSRLNVQCETDPNCNLTPSGICAAAPSGNHWCAYPDPNCPGGYRYSDVDVGDGVAGTCVAEKPDAGVDAPMPDVGPPPTQFMSCDGLSATCGGTDDCCNSPLVAGGTYYRSYDLAGDRDSGTPTYAATVGDFRLDKYEVTVGRFRKFVEAGMGTQASPPTVGSGAHAAITGSGWQADWNASLVVDRTALIAALKCDTANNHTWTDVPGTGENRPITCLTWYEAMAFCIWDGGYLPTEAEWNYAAAGGDQQRAYPWSIPASSLTLDGSYAVFYDGSPCGGTNPTPCPEVVEVGSKPLGNGRFGQSDLAGNAEEPVLDYDNRAGDPEYLSPCINCALIRSGDDFHRMRGGSAGERQTFLRTGRSTFIGPRDRFKNHGVRCARAP